MSERSARDEAAVRYLLSDMAEEEKAVLENSLFENEELFEQVAAAEDELIDDYLAGELSPEMRERFEKTYLALPERRERVEFARALRQRLASEPSQEQVTLHRPRKVFAARWLAAAAILFAVLGLYFATDALRMRRELARLEAERATAAAREQDLARQIAQARGRGERLEQELARLNSEEQRLNQQLAELQEHAGKSVSFTMVAGLLRDSGMLQTLRIPPDAATVRLTLKLPDASYSAYKAAIQTPEGREVWKGSAAPPPAGGKPLVLTVPARALPSGDYILSLTGVTAAGRLEPAADYSFRVKNR
jgi:cell division protein FtsL